MGTKLEWGNDANGWHSNWNRVQSVGASSIIIRWPERVMDDIPSDAYVRTRIEDSSCRDILENFDSSFLNGNNAKDAVQNLERAVGSDGRSNPTSIDSRVITLESKLYEMEQKLDELMERHTVSEAVSSRQLRNIDV